MLEIIRTQEGNIKAVCEWWLVNADGTFNQYGEYAWIAEMEINPQARGNGVLKEFIKIISNKAPNVKYGYFWREKYGKRLRMYHINKWLKLLKKE